MSKSSGLIRIGVLWRSDKGSKSIATGKLAGGNQVNLILMKNDRKEADNHPDFTLLIAQAERKESAAEEDVFEGVIVQDDDIPF